VPSHRQHLSAHGHSSQQIGTNVYASRNSIFNDDGPSNFGSAFGGVGEQNSHRQVNPSMGRDNLQVHSSQSGYHRTGSDSFFLSMHRTH